MLAWGVITSSQTPPPHLTCIDQLTRTARRLIRRGVHPSLGLKESHSCLARLEQGTGSVLNLAQPRLGLGRVERGQRLGLRWALGKGGGGVLEAPPRSAAVYKWLPTISAPAMEP